MLFSSGNNEHDDDDKHDEKLEEPTLSRKWFKPRSISSSYCVIVRARVVLKRTVVSD